MKRAEPQHRIDGVTLDRGDARLLGAVARHLECSPTQAARRLLVAALGRLRERLKAEREGRA